MHARVEALDGIPPQPQDLYTPRVEYSQPPDRAIPKDHYHIQYHMDGEPSTAMRTILKDTHQFATRVSHNVGNTVLDWMREESQKPYALHPRLHWEVKTKGLYMPRFDFYDREYAEAFFEEIDLTDETVHENGLLMVYDLPQPLAHFWWLMGGFEDEKPVIFKDESEIAKAVVYEESKVQEKINMGDVLPIPAWGKAYHGMRNIFWKEIKKVSPKVDFERIGEPGQHDSSHYYYLFEVRAVSDIIKEEEGITGQTIFTCKPTEKNSA